MRVGEYSSETVRKIAQKAASIFRGGNGAGDGFKDYNAKEVFEYIQNPIGRREKKQREEKRKESGLEERIESYARPEGNPPTLMDFDKYYFEGIYGIVGDQKAKYRALLNLINNTSMVFVGPSSGGKTLLQEAIVGLLPDDEVVYLADPNDVKDSLVPECTYGKVWVAHEFQTVIRGSKNFKDFLKLLCSKEGVRGMNIEMFITGVAVENEYFNKYIVPNRELMRRLDIIYVDGSFGKVRRVRESIARRRMGMGRENGRFSKDYFRKWVNYWRRLKLPQVIDPFWAFHDQYFVMSFKSFDPVKRYQRLEDALVKMGFEECVYDIGGRKICIIDLKRKYAGDSFRQEINRALIEQDDPRLFRKIYGWSKDDLKKYLASVKKAQEDVDWQACWDSGVESLKVAYSEGILPFWVVEEFIRRQVSDGVVAAVDNYTGETVILAEHPRKKKKRDKIVITKIEVLDVNGEKIYPKEENNRHETNALPEHKNESALPRGRRYLCLPPCSLPPGDRND